MLLKDRVAVITGAASGFGKVTSVLFSKEGAKILAVDYNADGEELVEEIKKNGGQGVALPVDGGWTIA